MVEQATELRPAPPAKCRMGVEFVALPDGCGDIVGMVIFQDRLYVACQWGVYRRDDGGIGWEQVMSVPHGA